MKSRFPHALGALVFAAAPLALAAADVVPPAAIPAVNVAHDGDPPPSARGARGAAVGDATRAWLQLQRSGAAASAQPQPMSGEVMEQVYARYLKSFAQPVPDELGSRQSR